MAIVAKKSSGDFVLCPAGSHIAVCVDVIDLGQIETTWEGVKKSQHKVRLVWQIAERMEDGKPYQVQRRYTLSLDDRAALRKDLESWRGRPFTEKELQGFDLEVLVGIGCMLSVVHQSRDGKTYDNVSSIMKLPKGVPTPSIESYTRKEAAEPAPDPADLGHDEPNDDDVPSF